MVAFSHKHPQGKVLGSRKVERVYQKGYTPLVAGDEVALYYLEWNRATGEESWRTGDIFTLKNSPSLAWGKAPDKHELWIRETDVCGWVRLAPFTSRRTN